MLLEVGQDVHWTGGNLQEAIFEGITQGTKQGYLRWSLIGDPLARRNPGGTPPGVIHYDIVPGDGVRLTVASKAFGAENMRALRMFTPADALAVSGSCVAIDRQRRLPRRRGRRYRRFERPRSWRKSDAASDRHAIGEGAPRSSRNCSTGSTASASARRASEAR